MLQKYYTTHVFTFVFQRQLSDVNRDGALSLEEFCTAMHLVVLRRNEIELPDHLPPVLMPYMQLSGELDPKKTGIAYAVVCLHFLKPPNSHCLKLQVVSLKVEVYSY